MTRRLRMASAVRFSFRAIEAISIFEAPEVAHPPRASMIGGLRAWGRPHFAFTFSIDGRYGDPNLRSDGSLIPSVKARWRTALSLRQRRFEIAATASPEAAAARS
jgi:hypothetical protein